LDLLIPYIVAAIFIRITKRIGNWYKLAQYKEKLTQAVLIVAGDISTDIKVMKDTLVFLKTIFAHVFFVPGNNELRITRGDKSIKNSVEKFAQVIQVCKEIGIEVEPKKVYNQVWIVPLFSWYTPKFDPKWAGDFTYTRNWLDFTACKWPKELSQEEGIANHFLEMNQKNISQSYDAPVITFSHFLPRKELIDTTLPLRNKSLPLVVGCPALESQLRAAHAVIHVFGHTHMNLETKIDGVKYIQNAFGHPSERDGLNIQALSEAIKCIYSVKEDPTVQKEENDNSNSNRNGTNNNNGL